MDALPSTIGRYQIREQLGQGGMGVLYLAFDPTMDRLVALKLLRLNDAQWRERFLREARLVARLQHPNIITIHDVGSSDGQPFMAMEYIAGNTLDTLIRRHVPLSHARKLEIMIALCDGLAYAHRSGVIHRDVKPSNLIVHRESGLLKVLDFGIARTNDSSLTLAGSIIGTPNYMSPEQVKGQAVDHRSDVFAVGAVLYELFAYRQAFNGETPYLVLQDIVHRTPERLVTIDPTLDPRLDAIVSRAIAKEPEARYPDLDVMRRDLIEALRHTASEEPVGREKTMVLLARAAGSDRVAVVTPPPMRAPSTPADDLEGDVDDVDDDDSGKTSVMPSSPDASDAPRAATVAENSESAATYVTPDELLAPLAPTQLTPPPPVESPREPAGASESSFAAASAAAADAGRSDRDADADVGRSSRSHGRLARIGLFAAAAALVLIVLPAWMLTSWSAPSGSARAAPATEPAASGANPRATLATGPAASGASPRASTASPASTLSAPPMRQPTAPSAPTLSATPLQQPIAPTASAMAPESVATALAPSARESGAHESRARESGARDAASRESGARASGAGTGTVANGPLRGVEMRGGAAGATSAAGTPGGRAGASSAATSVDPPAGKSDLKAMQQVLNRWKDAYENRDVAAVSRVWPTISNAQARNLDTAFDKMSQMTVLFRQCSLAGSVVRASATCRVERSITFKATRPETISSQVTFQLEKRADHWIIVGVRGA